MRSKEADRQTLILDLAGVSFIDKAGIDTLVDVVRTLQKNRTETSIAQCPPPVVKSLKRANFVDRVQHQHYPCRLYPTIHDAMLESCWFTLISFHKINWFITMYAKLMGIKMCRNFEHGFAI